MHDRYRVEIEAAIRACQVDTIGDAHVARVADAQLGEIEGVTPATVRIGRIDRVLVGLAYTGW